MIRVISDHWSWSGSSQRNAPLEKAAYENTESILGDPGADSGDEGKSKRAGKNGAKKSARLHFPYPPLAICPWVSEDVQNEDILINANRLQKFHKLAGLGI